MQTYKIWYEPDPDIPEFKMLASKLVDVDIKNVLMQGIHPIANRYAYRTLVEGFTHRLNVKQFMIPELADLKYCEPVQNYSYNNYYREYSHIEELIDRINKSVRFVDNLTCTSSDNPDICV